MSTTRHLAEFIPSGEAATVPADVVVTLAGVNAVHFAIFTRSTVPTVAVVVATTPTPDVVATTTAVPDPVIASGIAPTPDAVVTTSTVPSPTPGTGVTPTIGVVVSSSAVPTVSFDFAGTVATVTTIPFSGPRVVTAFVYDSAIIYDSEYEYNPFVQESVVTIAAIPVPTLVVNSTTDISAVPVATVAAVPVPTLVASFVLIPATVASTSTVSSPFVASGGAALINVGWIPIFA